MSATIFRDHVKHRFTDKEIADIARKQSTALHDRAAAEAELESFRSAIKARLSRCEADMAEFARKISDGYEMKEVECLLLKFRPDADSAMVVRTDSGTVVRVRKLEPNERQIVLSDQPPETISACADFEEDDGSEKYTSIPLYPSELERLISVREKINLRGTAPQLESGDQNQAPPKTEAMEPLKKQRKGAGR